METSSVKVLAQHLMSERTSVHFTVCYLLPGSSQVRIPEPRQFTDPYCPPHPLLCSHPLDSASLAQHPDQLKSYLPHVQTICFSYGFPEKGGRSLFSLMLNISNIMRFWPRLQANQTCVYSRFCFVTLPDCTHTAVLSQESKNKHSDIFRTSFWFWNQTSITR